MLNERKITRQFIDALNETNDPEQFTGVMPALGKEAGIAARNVVLDNFPGINTAMSFKDAIQNAAASINKNKLSKNFPGMQVAGFYKACLLFTEVADKETHINVEELFNECLEACGVTKYTLSEEGREAGVYLPVK